MSTTAASVTSTDTHLKAGQVLDYLKAAGLPMSWISKLQEIVKRSSGSAEPNATIIDTPETLKEMLVMSVPLLKRQIEAVDAIMTLVKQRDWTSGLAPTANMFANLLEETEVDSFAPAPRMLDPDHTANPEFMKIMNELGAKALFGDCNYAVIEEVQADGSFKWYIKETPKPKR